MPRAAKQTTAPPRRSGPARSADEVARALATRAPDAHTKFGWLLRLESDEFGGLLAPADCFHLAAQLEREDPRRYPAGRAVGLAQMDAAHESAIRDLHQAHPRILADAIEALSRERDWRVGAYTLAQASAVTYAARSADAETRYREILAAFVAQTSDDGAVAVERALRGTERFDDDPAHVARHLGHLFATGDPRGRIVVTTKRGRCVWTAPPRQVREIAGVPRDARTERERAARGCGTVPLVAADSNSRRLRECADPLDDLDAVLARRQLEEIRARTTDAAERAACDHLLDGLDLTEAAAIRGVGRTPARTALARVVERVRRTA